jgi:hypothetical protein
VHHCKITVGTVRINSWLSQLIAVLEKKLIVVSGSAAEEMMSCNQAFMFQNLFIVFELIVMIKNYNL